MDLKMIRLWYYNLIVRHYTGIRQKGAFVKDLKIEQVVLDRNAYAYHGRVQTLADAAREGGLRI